MVSRRTLFLSLLENHPEISTSHPLGRRKERVQIKPKPLAVWASKTTECEPVLVEIQYESELVAVPTMLLVFYQ